MLAAGRGVVCGGVPAGVLGGLIITVVRRLSMMTVGLLTTTTGCCCGGFGSEVGAGRAVRGDAGGSGKYGGVFAREGLRVSGNRVVCGPGGGGDNDAAGGGAGVLLGGGGSALDCGTGGTGEGAATILAVGTGSAGVCAHAASPSTNAMIRTPRIPALSTRRT